MDLPLDHVVGYGTCVVGIVASWFGMKYGLDRANEKIGENVRQIEAIWKWKDDHDKESNLIREKFNRDISELRASHLVATEQFKQIISILEDIKERLGELEDK